MSIQQEIKEQLKQILSEAFKFDISKISNNEPLLNGGLSLNSIQMIELTVAIEEYYDKEFEPEMLTAENFDNLDTVSKLIEDTLYKK